MIYYVLALASVIMNGAGQVMLKIGSRAGNSLTSTYLNPATLAGYIIFLMVVLLSTFTLRGMELKLFYALMSLNYVMVLLLSRLVLKEDLTRNKLIGVGIIIAGIFLFNI